MKNKFLYTISSLLLLALILGSICFNFYQLSKASSLLMMFMYIITVLSYLAALIYCLRGLKKNSAIYFKLFLMIYTISAALNLYIAVENKANIIIIILAILVLLFRGTLAFIEDLGKKLSYALSIGLLVCSIVLFIIYLNIDMTIALDVVGHIAADIILFIMIYAKYVDKDERHTN